MKKIFYIATMFISLNIYSQEIMTDWKKMDKTTPLKEYIEKNAYEFLNFRPNENDSINSYEKTISEKSSHPEFIIRDISSVPNKPLIIINNIPIIDEFILTELNLSEINKITILEPNEKTWALYGSSSKVGVIFIEMNKKKWEEFQRKYGS